MTPNNNFLGWQNPLIGDNDTNSSSGMYNKMLQTMQTNPTQEQLDVLQKLAVQNLTPASTYTPQNITLQQPQLPVQMSAKVDGVIPTVEEAKKSGMWATGTNPDNTNKVSAVDKNIMALASTAGLIMPDSLENSARRAGQALSFDPNSEFIADKGKARTGKTLGIIGNIGKFALGAARNIVSGMAEEHLYQQQMTDMQRKIAEANEGTYQIMEDGGTVGGFRKAVEVEDGEFIRTPEGELEEVTGRTHKEGGEIVDLDVMSEITSNNLEIGKSGIAKLTKLYPDLNLKIKPTDTYADVIRKAEDKLRIKDLDDEIEKTDKQKDDLNIDDTKTNDFVYGYLENKGVKLNKQKEALERIRLEFADSVFSLQENSKKNKESKLYNFFENGGTVNDEVIDRIYSNTGLPKTYISQLLRKHQLSYFERFADGGKVKVDDKFMYQTIYNKFRKEEGYGHQKYTKNDYGILTSGDVSKNSYQDRLTEMLRIFPKIDRYFDVQYNDDGSIKSATPKNKNSVEEAQRYQQRVYDNHLKFADKFITNEGERGTYKDLISSFMFDPNNKESVKFFDNKLGDFTSSRSVTELALMTEDERKALADKGIDRFTKVFEDGKIKDLGLSEETSNRLNEIYKLYGDDFEAGFLPIPQTPTETPVPTNKPADPEKKEDIVQPDPRDGVNKFDASGLGKKPFIPPVLPNQYRNDWDNVASHLKVDTTYGRLGYDRIEDSGILESIYQSQGITQKMLDGMTDAQRLAVQSDAIAKSQAAINQANLEVSTKNRMMENEIDKFNIGQRDREVDANNINLLDFEKRQYSAKEITDANNTTIQNHNKKVAVSDFATLAKLRNINNLFENYSTDIFGGVVYSGGSNPLSYTQDGQSAAAAYIMSDKQREAERLEKLKKAKSTKK